MVDAIALPTSSPTLTWLGHASARLSHGQNHVLFDPLGRRRTNAVAPTGILITHAHVDHLNRWTLAGLDRASELIVPKGAGPIVADLGFRHTREVEPGDTFLLGDMEVTCVPTKHDNGRWKKGDVPICTGYVVRAGEFAVHHAGDVDFSDHDVFDDIGRAHKLDVTLLPVGGMLPVWYYRWRRGAIDRGVHIDPDCALQIYEQLGASTMVPVHWGTVRLPLEPSDSPVRRLRELAAASRANVRVLAHGEALSKEPSTEPRS